MAWDQSRVKTKNRGCGRHKSMRLEKNATLLSIPLLWWYWWSWSLCQFQPLVGSLQAAFSQHTSQFLQQTTCSRFFSSAYIWVLFPIFLPVLLQCRWKGWKVVWLSRLCRNVNTSVDWWKQWLNLSDHVVVVICLARGAIGNFLGVCWWNVCFLLVFGKPKDWPSSAASELAEFRLLNCQGQIAVAPWLTLSPHLNLVLMLYFL